MTIATQAFRNSDPPTSALAAEYVDRSGLRANQQRQVAAAVREWPGSTSYELSVRMRADRAMPARRLRELADISVVIEGKLRRCTISGRLSITWWPAKPGEQLELLAA